MSIFAWQSIHVGNTCIASIYLCKETQSEHVGASSRRRRGVSMSDSERCATLRVETVVTRYVT